MVRIREFLNSYLSFVLAKDTAELQEGEIQHARPQPVSLQADQGLLLRSTSNRTRFRRFGGLGGVRQLDERTTRHAFQGTPGGQHNLEIAA